MIPLEKKKVFFQLFFLLLLALGAGALRQFFPKGVSWKGKWPTSATSAEDAYRMMAKPNDAPFIGIAEVISLHRGDRTVLLDARSHQEYLDGHIPGARNLPYYEIGKYQDAALKGLPADSPLIIYCEGVGCELSFFLARDLQAAGYSNIRIFYGGFPEWKNAGLPVEK